jgi:DNA repair exonuclease SbcCD ATPase subunit
MLEELKKENHAIKEQLKKIMKMQNQFNASQHLNNALKDEKNLKRVKSDDSLKYIINHSNESIVDTVRNYDRSADLPPKLNL